MQCALTATQRFTMQLHVSLKVQTDYASIHYSIDNRVGEGLETARAGQRVMLLTVNGYYKLITNFSIFFEKVYKRCLQLSIVTGKRRAGLQHLFPLKICVKLCNAHALSTTLLSI